MGKAPLTSQPQGNTLSTTFDDGEVGADTTNDVSPVIHCIV